jgi:hypothetical protein
MDFDFSPVESLDKVPEEFRPIYAQKAGDDGKFVIEPTFAKVAASINGFNKSNKTLRNELKSTKVDLSPLSEFGADPAAIKAAIDAKLSDAQKAAGQDVNKQIEGVKAALATAHKGELDKRDARNQGLQNQLYTMMVENAATSAIVELKGVPDLLMPFVKNFVKVNEKDGQFHVSVVDAQGEIRYGNTGSPMSIKELIAEMKANEKYGRLFESDQPNGGGGFQPGAGRQNQQPKKGEKSANDKISAGLKHRFRV